MITFERSHLVTEMIAQLVVYWIISILKIVKSKKQAVTADPKAIH